MTTRLGIAISALLLSLPNFVHAGYIADALKSGGQSSAQGFSAGRAIQFTPETYDCLARGLNCGTTLFQADIGNERWSINGDVATNILTGNVFFEDVRAPVFLWCPIIGTQGVSPTGSFVLRCFAANNCAGGPCFEEQWEEVGVVNLPMSYVFP